MRIDKPGAYMILNLLANARYVGSSARTLASRFSSHRWALRHNVHDNKHLQAAWNKYGESAFIFVPLKNCVKGRALEVEKCWYEKFKEAGFPLYNLRENVESQLGMHHSEETKRKISEILTGKPHNVSPEGRKKLSEKASGNRYGAGHGCKGEPLPFSVISPEGELITGINLNRFAIEHNLDSSAFAMVASGARPSHKGWTSPDAREAYLRTHPLKRPANLIHDCEECGRPFHIKPSEKGVRHFCSKTCRARHDARIYSGAGNPNYRDGNRMPGIKRKRKHITVQHD